MYASVLVLSVAAATGATCGRHAPDHGPSDGPYVSLPSDGASCNLEITCGEAFALRCHKRPPVTGAIHGIFNWFLLSPKPRTDSDPLDPALEWDAALRQSAVRQYMEQHLKENGFYPLLTYPTPPPPVDGTWEIMVAVRFRDHHYLVDLFARDGFCSSARAGREPKSTVKEHRVFKSRRSLSQGTTVSWDEFCAPEWKPRYE